MRFGLACNGSGAAWSVTALNRWNYEHLLSAHVTSEATADAFRGGGNEFYVIRFIAHTNRGATECLFR